MKNKVKLFVFWLIPIVLSIIAIFGISRILQDVENIKNEQKQLINQVKSISITAPANISNKQVFVLQDQISKLQDFEDRRYDAITTQLNSFWSGVNGFLALIGIFFAIFSWYLTKQVESANTNLKEIQDELDKAAASRKKIEEYQTNIEQFIESKSVELFQALVRKDVAEQIDELILDHSLMATKFDFLINKIKYIDVKQWQDFVSKIENLESDAINFRLFEMFLAISLSVAPNEVSEKSYNRFVELIKSIGDNKSLWRAKLLNLGRISRKIRTSSLINLINKYSTLKEFEQALVNANVNKTAINDIKNEWLTIQ